MSAPLYLDLPSVILEDLNNGEQALYFDALYKIGDEEIIVPKGFVTDWASIPRIFTPVFPVLGKHNHAVLLHDYLYKYQRYSKDQADEWMRLVALHDGTRPWRAWSMYHAVKLYGHKAWNDSNKVIYKYKGV